jgi:pilus assembly protein Flp/PilA
MRRRSQSPPSRYASSRRVYIPLFGSHLRSDLEKTMKPLVIRFVRDEQGQDLVEYALLITFIALACIVGMQQLGTAINNNYQSISTSLQTGS